MVIITVIAGRPAFCSPAAPLVSTTKRIMIPFDNKAHNIKVRTFFRCTSGHSYPAHNRDTDMQAKLRACKCNAIKLAHETMQL